MHKHYNKVIIAFSKAQFAVYVPVFAAVHRLLKPSTMEELKHLKILATNSKLIIGKQLDSYRHQHAYAGPIIGATALYIPFFLCSLTSTWLTSKRIFVFPIVCFIISNLLMLTIFRTRPLYQAINVLKYCDLQTSNYRNVPLFVINANTAVYNNNRPRTDKRQALFPWSA